jgi:hypothetical protein
MPAALVAQFGSRDLAVAALLDGARELETRARELRSQIPPVLGQKDGT